jgi:predicted transcriptional regulator
MTERANQTELLALTASIVSSHVSNNTVTGGNLTKMIREVYETLSQVGEPEQAKAGRPDPAVPIKKSVTPDYIVCLEDGKKLKMLKRHLSTAYDLTPEQYRERWGLPVDYPMVAPNYAKRRSQLARDIGLGTRRKRTSRSNGKS